MPESVPPRSPETSTTPVQPCTPFKVLTQLVRDGAGGQPELVWKALTAQGSNPDGPPITPGTSEVGVGFGKAL